MSYVHEGHVFIFELTQDHALHLRGIKGTEVGEYGDYLHDKILFILSLLLLLLLYPYPSDCPEISGVHLPQFGLDSIKSEGHNVR
ncbi:Uncharacterised protein [uncultured archaeon]|nr:Uncharacterised protein [uncultured archaeon]